MGVNFASYVYISMRREVNMLIRVFYTDGTFDMVKPVMLDYLLDKNKVKRFKRSTGWAVVGRDSIRSKSTNRYLGEDRRASLV